MAKPRYNSKTRRWVVCLYAKLPDGTVFRKNKSFKDKSDALEWEKQSNVQIRAVKSKPISQKILLADAVKSWLAYCQRHSETTQNEYELKINMFVRLLPPEITFVNDIQLSHINTYVAQLLSNGIRKPCKPSTINTRLNTVKSFFRFVEDNYNIENPTNKWKPIRVNHQKVSCPTKEQFQTLIENIIPELVPVIRFTANTGLRSQEIIDLKWKDVDENQKTITIVGKGSKQRTIPLNSNAQSILEKLKPDKPERNQNIFILKSRPLDSKALYYQISKAFRHCGMPGSGLHSLRHFFATQLLLAGTPIIMVSRILGHSSITTTQAHYSHILPENLATTCDCINF